MEAAQKVTNFIGKLLAPISESTINKRTSKKQQNGKRVKRVKRSSSVSSNSSTSSSFPSSCSSSSGSESDFEDLFTKPKNQPVIVSHEIVCRLKIQRSKIVPPDERGTLLKKIEITDTRDLKSAPPLPPPKLVLGNGG